MKAKTEELPLIGEVYEALAEIQAKFTATKDDLCRDNYIESAGVWESVIAQTEDAVKAGGHSPAELRLLQQRAQRAREALDRITADIALIPERQKLDDLRLKLEAAEERRQRFDCCIAEPLRVPLPEPFAAAMTGAYTLPEGCAASLVKLFADLAAPVDAAAALVNAAFAEVEKAAALVAAIENVDPGAPNALRETRLVLVVTLKEYLEAAAAANAKAGLAATDALELVAETNAAVEKKAAAVIEQIVGRCVKAGMAERAARAGARDAAEVTVIYARAVDPAAISGAFDQFCAALIRKAMDARRVAEGELAALV